jgi:GNAT superfamily N-acetyltransferase
MTTGIDMSTVLVEPLLPDQIQHYATLTYPKFRSLLMTSAQSDQTDQSVISVGASLRGTPIGLALGQFNKQLQSATLLSVVTKPEYRQQGIAARLLGQFETSARRAGAVELATEYSTAVQAYEIVERLLQRASWQTPTPKVTMVYFPGTAENYVRWNTYFPRQAPPDGYLFRPFHELTSAQIALIQEKLEQNIIPALFSPFQYVKPDQASTALDYNGEIISWTILQRATPDLVRVICLYLDPNYRGQRLGFQLVNETVHRFMTSFDPIVQPQTIMTWTDYDNYIMLTYLDTLSPCASRKVELRTVVKPL